MTYLIIVDLEATCDVNDKINRSAMEIIEFGAAKIDVGSFNILDSYQGYIKPVVNPVLTPFCKNLTGISQNEVDDAPYFYEALNLFSMWMFESGSINAWASWGGYDKSQLEQDCIRHQQDNPLSVLKHVNLKTGFAKALDVRSCGMERAFDLIGERLEGRHHSGHDDAVNLGRLMPLSPKFGKFVQKQLP